jgi:hypothetical protein
LAGGNEGNGADELEGSEAIHSPQITRMGPDEVLDHPGPSAKSVVLRSRFPNFGCGEAALGFPGKNPTRLFWLPFGLAPGLELVETAASAAR